MKFIRITPIRCLAGYFYEISINKKLTTIHNVTPTDGKRAEATPNTEMILVSDVDLDLLNELHTYGSVRNLKDRRGDLYEVKMKR